MRRVWGTLLVVVVATTAGVWIARPIASTPVIEARPVALTVPPTTTTVAPEGPAGAPALTGPFRIAAVIGKRVPVHASPGGPIAQTLANPMYTLPLVLLVKSQPHENWLEVHLPTRPNGSTGFVHVAEVRVSEMTTQILVEQKHRRLTAWDGGRLVFETPVAIGKPSTPTPNGLFYLQGAAKMTNPRGSYGPFILALSAHSEVYKTFAGGDGLVGIHGTNAPSSIGNPVSNGCIRVSNAAIVELAELVPAGSPVVVVP